jgi:hypothetical protein
MARRILQIDDKPPVQPVANRADEDGLPLNTFPPEAVSTMTGEEMAAQVRRTLVTERPQVARIDEIAVAARAAQERAIREQQERTAMTRVAEAARRERAREQRDAARAVDISRLFGPGDAPAPKPSIDVRGAVVFLASKLANLVESHSVLADMASRGSRFTSARQFEYAKALCNRRGNRILLRADYDLQALDREEWQPAQPSSQPVRAETFGDGVRVAFSCVITGVQPTGVMISFAYNVDGKQAVRSIAAPSNRITISGAVGDRVRCSVDAEWLLAERRIDGRMIPGSSLSSTRASTPRTAPRALSRAMPAPIVPAAVRRRVRPGR